jgi:hypothetical protein
MKPSKSYPNLMLQEFSSSAAGANCGYCNGTGRCHVCNGVGSIDGKECVICWGKRRCTHCNGTGVYMILSQFDKVFHRA